MYPCVVYGKQQSVAYAIIMSIIFKDFGELVVTRGKKHTFWGVI